jgi:hypothetical protein
LRQPLFLAAENTDSSLQVVSWRRGCDFWIFPYFWIKQAVKQRFWLKYVEDSPPGREGMAFAQTKPHEVSTKVTRTEFFGAVTQKKGPHTGGDSALPNSRKESRK